MSKTDYIGIDYGAYGLSNRDPDNGIHYGVISIHTVDPEALEDVIRNGRDTLYEEARKELTEQVKACVRNLYEEVEWVSREMFLNGLIETLKPFTWSRLAERISDSLGRDSQEMDLEEDLENVESAVDEWFGDFYDHDSSLAGIVYEEGDLHILGSGDTYLMVTKSPYYTYSQYCSPCYPGAGNLDTECDPESGAPRTYCLDHDWFENNKAPYRVWRERDAVELVSEIQEVPCPYCNGAGTRPLSQIAAARGCPVEDIREEFKNELLPDDRLKCWSCEGGKKSMTVIKEQRAC
jgi:hypothetical protein